MLASARPCSPSRASAVTFVADSPATGVSAARRGPGATVRAAPRACPDCQFDRSGRVRRALATSPLQRRRAGGWRRRVRRTRRNRQDSCCSDVHARGARAASVVPPFGAVRGHAPWRLDSLVRLGGHQRGVGPEHMNHGRPRGGAARGSTTRAGRSAGGLKVTARLARRMLALSTSARTMAIASAPSALSGDGPRGPRRTRNTRSFTPTRGRPSFPEAPTPVRKERFGYLND